MPLKSDPIFEKMKAAGAKVDPDPANRKAVGIFLLQINQDGKLAREITLDLRFVPNIYEGPVKDAKEDVLIKVEDDILALILEKKYALDTGIKEGKIVITGDKELSGKLTYLAAKMRELA